MCIVQLLGSLSTIACICLQINPSRSLNYALHAQPLIPSDVYVRNAGTLDHGALFFNTLLQYGYTV